MLHVWVETCTVHPSLGDLSGIHWISFTYPILVFMDLPSIQNIHIPCTSVAAGPNPSGMSPCDSEVVHHHQTTYCQVSCPYACSLSFLQSLSSYWSCKICMFGRSSRCQFLRQSIIHPSIKPNSTSPFSPLLFSLHTSLSRRPLFTFSPSKHTAVVPRSLFFPYGMHLSFLSPFLYSAERNGILLHPGIMKKLVSD